MFSLSDGKRFYTSIKVLLRSCSRCCQENGACPKTGLKVWITTPSPLFYRCFNSLVIVLFVRFMSNMNFLFASILTQGNGYLSGHNMRKKTSGWIELSRSEPHYLDIYSCFASKLFQNLITSIYLPVNLELPSEYNCHLLGNAKSHL